MMLPNPQEIHRAEQLQAAIRETASGMWVFYSALVSEGFKPEQAFTLTGVYLSTILSRPAEPQK